MATIIDAHQHFWTYGTYQTSWMEKPPYAGDPAFEPLRRAFTPADLEPLLHAAGVHRTVVIQAADGPDENAALLRYAQAHEWIAGVVGWVPLDRPDEAVRTLDALAGEPRFVGVRHLINVEPNPDWIVRKPVLESLALLAERDLCFDLVAILPRHLEHVPAIAAAVPGLRLIIDHLGKPPIAAREWEPWASLITRAADAPNVFAKVSGLDTAARAGWTADDLSRYVDHALAAFGAERLMWGSDWPVSILGGGYAHVWQEMNRLFARFSPLECDQLLRLTATRVYRLEEVEDRTSG
ncbi:MAG TPA: amidohydrolase family protein [Nitrospiraceae bacterium]|nr:amidohydrolase family protein [Nitrospiraceae bacterium]